MSTGDRSVPEVLGGEDGRASAAPAAPAVAVLVLTHGPLARELLASARAIAGPLEHFDALPLSWDDGIDEARRKIDETLRRLDRGSGVLILTDIFGGTPSNVAMALREPGRVEVVSGVNLPMLVRLGCAKDSRAEMSLAELAGWIRDKGKASICCGSDRTRSHRARTVGRRSRRRSAADEPASGSGG